MFDPFQTQKKPAQARPVQRVGALTDTSPDAARMRPRSRKFLRAVEMLDVLTSDEKRLYEYLSAKAVEAKPAASNPFAANRSAAGVAAEKDVIDELLQTPPPPLDTPEFQELKDELCQKCQEAVQEQTAFEDEEVAYLASCGLLFHCIHWLDKTGAILRHYRPRDLDTPLLQKADELLRQGFILIEVRGGFPDAGPGSVLYAVRETGAVQKVML